MILLTMIIPLQTIIIPQFMFFKNFDLFGGLRLFFPDGISLLDSPWPMILPAIFGLGLKGSLFIYIFRQFYRGLPNELEDSAYIDGCGPVSTYLRVMVPNAKPAIVTVMMFSFVWHWNDFFEPDMWLSDPSTYTLPQKLLTVRTILMGKYGNPHAGTVPDPTIYIGTLFAGVVMVIIPMIVFFVIGQRFFVENVERSGIVG
ncbi:MAG: carbohydrate ABC transporter permease [Oscillospiraceae bacterium]|nr:carbohydrate ABC transporter permease [Oscillospiraceae bacterium]